MMDRIIHARYPVAPRGRCHSLVGYLSANVFNDILYIYLYSRHVGPRLLHIDMNRCLCKRPLRHAYALNMASRRAMLRIRVITAWGAIVRRADRLDAADDRAGCPDVGSLDVLPTDALRRVLEMLLPAAPVRRAAP